MPGAQSIRVYDDYGAVEVAECYRISSEPHSYFLDVGALNLPGVSQNVQALMIKLLTAAAKGLSYESH